MKNSNIIVAIIGIIIILFIYFNIKSHLNKIDNKHFINTIDSLYNINDSLNYKYLKLDSIVLKLNDSIIITYKQIEYYKLKEQKAKIKYEKEINRIDTLSNNDIIREFTNTFK